MDRPTWATVVGILGVLLSCFGIIIAGQEIVMPEIIKFQKEMLLHLEDYIREETGPQATEEIMLDKGIQENDRTLQQTPQFPVNILKLIKKALEVPDWYNTWTVISGLTKLITSAFLLFAAGLLLQVKSGAIRMFYRATGLSIAFGLAKSLVFLSTLSFIGIMTMFGCVLGVVIDIVLIIVVAAGDKEAFCVQAPRDTYNLSGISPVTEQDLI